MNPISCLALPCVPLSRHVAEKSGTLVGLIYLLDLFDKTPLAQLYVVVLHMLDIAKDSTVRQIYVVSAFRTMLIPVGQNAH